MPPRKKAVEVAPTTRVTRSSAKRGEAPVVVPEVKKRPNKKAKLSPAPLEDPPADDVADDVEAAGVQGKTIVIEHCKQCNSFKTRALQVKNGLEKGVPGITVLVNPEKPRKGCFEIREEGGEKFITLLDMPRPFKLMKDLDMDQVISDVIDKIK